MTTPTPSTRTPAMRSEISRFMPITEAMPPLSPWRKTDVRPVTPSLADAVLGGERS